MRKSLFILFSLLATALQAQDIIYEKEDSVFITNLLEKHAGRQYGSTGDLLLAVAEEFIDCKYVAGTLDNHPCEPLFISTSAVDCTTFVEMVVAIGIGIKNEEKSFSAVCRNLEKIRYRNGRRNGYTSRLHYISQWIDDDAKRGTIEDVTDKIVGCKQLLDLHFMSKNPGSYKQLSGNPALVKEIKKWEQAMQGREIRYIPKEKLGIAPSRLGIKNGDIIALTTNIKGLDVVHIGFALIRNGKLHLLHASSNAGKVINDDTELFVYQKKRKSQTGIRVFRAMCQNGKLLRCFRY